MIHILHVQIKHIVDTCIHNMDINMDMNMDKDITTMKKKSQAAATNDAGPQGGQQTGSVIRGHASNDG